jgi:hypothetical protein
VSARVTPENGQSTKETKMIAIATALMISFPAAAGLPPRFELPSACEPSWGVSIRNRHAIATAADDNKLRGKRG